MRKKIVVLTIVAIAVILTFGITILERRLREGETPAEEGFHYVFTREWLKKGNIWVFGQPPEEYLGEIRATGTAWSVYYNGLNTHDRKYVEHLHRRGFVVCSGPPTVQSSTTDNEQLKQEACERDIYGNPVRFLGLEQYAMCGNNPKWQDFLLRRFEEHAAGGVDAILIDEIGDTGGFCEHCMQVFNSYLAEHYSSDDLRKLFGIEDISTFNYRLYLLERGATDYWGDPNPTLAMEYVNAKRSARLEFIRRLVQRTKEVAGREILIAGNLYGFAPDEQIYFPYLDFAISEIPIIPELHEWLHYLRPLPGKHITTYLLAEALAPDKPFTALPDVWDLANLSEDEWWLWRHWLAEARACGASFLIPYQQYTYGGGSYTLSADKISPYTIFFDEHPQYFENVERVASVAVLYDLHSTLNNRYIWMAPLAWESFENVGVALQGAHIPFEVVYRGDGSFVKKSLTLEQLRRHEVLIVPRNYDLDDEARDLLSLYSALGGRVVRCDELPDDSALIKTIRDMDVDLGLETDAPEDLGMVVYRRGNSLLIHLINYSYDRKALDFLEQRNIKVTLTIPIGVDLEGKTLKLISPDASTMELKFEKQGEKVTFTVPVVHCYSIASFE